MNELEIAKGDYVTIKVGNFVIHGRVTNAYHDPLTKQFGLEICGPNGAFYWKQWIDGGKVVKIEKVTEM